MKFIKKILTIAFLIVAALFIYALFLPSKRTIERSIRIKAPVNKVYEEVADLKNWSNWSPMQQSDSTIKISYEGNPKGKGAIMTWTSNISNNGKIHIVESTENKNLKMELIYDEEDTSVNFWNFETQGDSTRVTWRSEMKNLSYPKGRLVGYFMSGMIENSYEDGLKRLSILTTQRPSESIISECGQIVEKEIEAQPALAIKLLVKADDNLEQKLDAIYTKITQYAESKQIQIAGPPFFIYYSDDPQAKEFEMAAGFPISKEAQGEGEIIYQPLYGGKVLMVTHCGSYKSLPDTYFKLFNQLNEKGYGQAAASWESYLTDPKTEKDTSKWVTQIYLPAL